MSASPSEIRGGQPSITQPIAGPWLSPQLVKVSDWPNRLNDILGGAPWRYSETAMSGALGFFMPTMW